MARVFLTGGGGFIGGELAAALVACGHDVVALARSDAAAARLADRGARVVRGDVLDADGLARAMAGCELAYHVAGVNSHCPKDPERLWRVNVEGAENAVRAAARAGVGRVVLTSSATTIGEPPGTVGREDTPHRGWYLSLYDRAKHAGERAAFAAGRETGVAVVALNPSSVQGPPRATGNGALVIAFLNGRLRAFVDTWVPIVDVRDVVQAHLLAAERGRPGERYLLNGDTLRSRDALELLRALSGVRDRVVMVPPALARGAATVVDAALRLRGRTSPICRARVDTILHGHRYDGGRAERELGVVYTPVVETFRRTIAWAVEQGLVRRPLPARR